MRRHRHTRGFMLIELLIVILIMGLFYARTDLTDPKILLILGGVIVGAILLMTLVVPRMATSFTNMLTGTTPLKDKVGKHIILARAHDRQGNHSSAISEYETAIRKDKKNVELHLELFDLYCRLGDYDRAIGQCMTLLKADRRMSPGQKFGLVSRMADIYIKKNDRKGAVAVLEGIAEQHPQSKYAAIARERIAKLRAGTVSIQ